MFSIYNSANKKDETEFALICYFRYWKSNYEFND